MRVLRCAYLPSDTAMTPCSRSASTSTGAASGHSPVALKSPTCIATCDQVDLGQALDRRTDAAVTVDKQNICRAQHLGKSARVTDRTGLVAPYRLTQIMRQPASALVIWPIICQHARVGRIP